MAGIRDPWSLPERDALHGGRDSRRLDFMTSHHKWGPVQMDQPYLC